MTPTEQKAFDQMREALEIAGKHLAYVEIFEALTAANAVSEQQGEVQILVKQEEWGALSPSAQKKLTAMVEKHLKANAEAKSNYPAVALGAHPQATEPAGWKLVPVEPTKNMLIAGYGLYYADACYRAMLAAAPEAHHGK